MSVILDVFFAAIIAGIIFLAILGLDTNLNQASYNNTFSLITQSNAVALARMIEYDFVKMGNNVPYQQAILTARPDSITFKADLGNSGPSYVNIVTYCLAPTSTLASTMNPNDRLIYRIQDGQVTPMNLGVTNLTFTYYDANQNITAIDSLIRSIDVKFIIQSPEKVDTSFSTVFWEKTFQPKCLAKF